MSEDLIRMYADLDDTPVTREAYVRAPFDYPGNKVDSLEHILPLLANLDVFVDVFGGSGIVTLNRKPSKLDVYNDRWSGVVAFYRCMREESKLDALIERIKLTPYAREEFVWCKQTWEDCTEDVERAARWYTLVQCSFGGLARNFGRALGASRPLARKIYENIPDFSAIHERFKMVQVENLDFRQCFVDYDSPMTCFYLDPPYYENNIYQVDFRKQDHLEMLDKIFKCQGFVALSGYPNEAYSKFPWDAIHHWPRKDRMKTQATETDTGNVLGMDMTRGDVEEYLWIKEAY